MPPEMDDGGNGYQLRPPSDAAGLAAYWAVYDRDHVAVRAEYVRALVAIESLPPRVVDYLTRLTTGEGSEELHAIFETAMVRGDWEPYLALIREIGAGYARLDLALPEWHEIARGIHRPMRRRLIAEYLSDPAKLEAALNVLAEYLDMTMSVIGDEYVKQREARIGEQSGLIRELSTPVLLVRPGVLLVPLVGSVDAERSSLLTAKLLESVRSHQARSVVLDLTGAPALDEAVTARLVAALSAARLLGAEAVVSGLSTQNAQTCARLGVDFAGVRVVVDLAAALDGVPA